MFREMKSFSVGVDFPIEQLLEKFVIRKAAFYDLMISLIGAGPLDGGCYLLAKALQNMYGGSLWGIWSRRPPLGTGVLDHVLLRKGPYFYDGDGVWKSAKSLLNFFKDDVGFWGEPQLIKIDGSLSEIDYGEIPTDTSLVGKVETYLREKANAPTSR